jgi:hypothetical protein
MPAQAKVEAVSTADIEESEQYAQGCGLAFGRNGMIEILFPLKPEATCVAFA